MMATNHFPDKPLQDSQEQFSSESLMNSRHFSHGQSSPSPNRSALASESDRSLSDGKDIRLIWSRAPSRCELPNFRVPIGRSSPAGEVFEDDESPGLDDRRYPIAPPSDG